MARDDNGKLKWDCRCTCGKHRIVINSYLTAAKSKNDPKACEYCIKEDRKKAQRKERFNIQAFNNEYLNKRLVSTL
jgi:hypothetical protein